MSLGLLAALAAYDVRWKDPAWPGSVLFGEFAFNCELDQNTAGGENLFTASGHVGDPAIRGELLGDVDGTGADPKLVLIADGLEGYVEMASESEAVVGKVFRNTYLRSKRGDRDRYTWVGRHLNVLAQIQHQTFDSDQTTQTSTTRIQKLNHEIDVELSRPIVCDLSGSDTLAIGTGQALGAASADLEATWIFHGAVGTEQAMREFISYYTTEKPTLGDFSSSDIRKAFRGMRQRRRMFLPGRR